MTTGSSSDLGFEARHRLDHTIADLSLVCWHAEASRDGGAWHQAEGGISFLTGHLRWQREDWAPASGWAEHLARAGKDRPLDELHDALRGVFIAGHISSTGDGWVTTDVLGLRCLYWGEDDDVFVVSSRATLVARALSPASPPQRDVGPGSWLAFTGHNFGDQTGYAQVQIAPAGGRLCLSACTPTWERTNPLIVEPGDQLRSLSIGDLADIVQDDVAESLRATLSHPADGHIIRLTGGKDSRLILAVAVQAGLAHEFTYETAGNPELADVQIAAALCENLGLRHTTHYLRYLGLLPAQEPFATRFRRFVEQTACLVSGRDLRSPTEMQPAVRLTGLFGESLRGYVRLRDEQLTPTALPQAVKPYEGRLALLQPATRAAVQSQIRHLLATQPHPSADPRDRVLALYAGGHTRFTSFGPREEIGGIRRCHPLYSRTTLRVAMAMDPADRADEILHAEVMRRASPMLAEHPFTKAWNHGAQAYLERVGDAPRPPSAATQRPSHPVEALPDSLGSPQPATTDASSLLSSIYATGSNDRTALLTEVLADRNNPAWEVLDRTVALEALDRFTTLSNRQRKELFGAATAAVWLER